MTNLADYRIDRSRLLLPGLLLALGGCINPLGKQISCDDSDLQITQWPPSARIQKEKCSAGFNPTYKSTLTILPQDLSKLQQQVPFDKIQQWRPDTSSIQP